MDTEFPTYQNYPCWKPVDLTTRVKGIFDQKELNPSESKLISKLTGRRITIHQSEAIITANFQKALYFSLLQGIQIYDNQPFQEYLQTFCPEVKKSWFSFAQMVYVGFELMKLKPELQPTDLQELYQETLAELNKDSTPNRRKKRAQFLKKAESKPKFEDWNFEELFYRSPVTYQFQFREFIRDSTIVVARCLEEEELTKISTGFDITTGNQRGGPTRSLIYLP